LAGSTEAAEKALATAGIAPLERGEALTVADFARISEALEGDRA
jgi:16S rRNA (adenine1518-N6/adenine1519-N6)-dimethyltransferase